MFNGNIKARLRKLEETLYIEVPKYRDVPVWDAQGRLTYTNGYRQHLGTETVLEYRHLCDRLSGRISQLETENKKIKELLNEVIDYVYRNET